MNERVPSLCRWVGVVHRSNDGLCSAYNSFDDRRAFSTDRTPWKEVQNQIDLGREVTRVAYHKTHSRCLPPLLSPP